MTSMLVGTIEHVCAAYDDNTGHGMTLCEKSIGPCDLGPRMEKATCEDCLRIALANDLFQLVEADQGFAFISDGLANLSREEILGVARASLVHTENVARKLKKWIKHNSSGERKP